MDQTLLKCEERKCRMQTCGPSVSLAKTFQSLADNGDLTEQEAAYFMKLCASSAKKVKINPNGLSLKTLKTFYQSMQDEDLARYSIKWPRMGTMQSGRFLIQKTSAFRRIENGSLLSDVLEKEVEGKYYLSQNMVDYLIQRMMQTKDGHKPRFAQR